MVNYSFEENYLHKILICTCTHFWLACLQATHSQYFNVIKFCNIENLGVAWGPEEAPPPPPPPSHATTRLGALNLDMRTMYNIQYMLYLLTVYSLLIIID